MATVMRQTPFHFAGKIEKGKGIHTVHSMNARGMCKNMNCVFILALSINCKAVPYKQKNLNKWKNIEEQDILLTELKKEI